jgi:hypothetical protein
MLVPKLARLGALFALLFLLGCAGRLDGAVQAANAARLFLAEANVALGEVHRSARDAAVSAAPDEETARRSAAEVHRTLLPLWQAYEVARFAWLGSASTIRAAQALDLAGVRYDGEAVTAALLQLGAAYEAFRRAAMAARVAVPVLP